MIELTKLSIQRLLALKKKQYKRLFEPEDYIWTCQCKDCLEQKRILAEIREEIFKIKDILKDREYIEK